MAAHWMEWIWHASWPQWHPSSHSLSKVKTLPCPLPHPPLWRRSRARRTTPTTQLQSSVRPLLQAPCKLIVQRCHGSAHGWRMRRSVVFVVTKHWAITSMLSRVNHARRSSDGMPWNLRWMLLLSCQCVLLVRVPPIGYIKTVFVCSVYVGGQGDKHWQTGSLEHNQWTS